MKKLLLTIVLSVFYVSSASAEMGVNVGVSGQAGIFAASATESTGTTKKGNGSEHGSAGWGSVFVEGTFNDRFIIGIDYVPQSLETDTTETAKSDKGVGAVTATTVTNKVQVDFEDLTTIYGTFDFNDNIYAKLGYMEVDAISNETLATGGKYGNATLDGYTVGLGYKRDLVSATFIRLEASYSEFDGVTLINTVDTSKRVTVDGLSGYGAKISVGKSF